jgi:predicted transcriptional regulator of viral defense system
MSRLAVYGTLERLGPVVTTAEAAAALRRDASSTSRLLRGLAEAGRARRIRPGLWAIGVQVPDPFALAVEVTRPHPAYVSFLSALNYHAMIDQLPREVWLASLDRSRRIETSIATFSVHHLPPSLFGGWSESRRGPIATPEKALFDLAYIGAAHRGRPRRVPEMELPAGFDRSRIDVWLDRIETPRLATLAHRGVDDLLSRAAR